MDFNNDELNQKYARVQSIGIFFALSFLSFGLYLIYWMYRQWDFFRDKDNLDILPPARAIFNQFYIHGLLNRINKLVVNKGISPSPALFLGWLFIIFTVVGAVIGQINDLFYFLIQMILIVFSILCFIIPLDQMNKYWQLEAPEIAKKDLYLVEKVILVVGGIFWALIIIGLIGLFLE